MTSPLTEQDLIDFSQGAHLRLYEKLGAHPMRVEGRAGVRFAVWAPNATRVSVVGDFNEWDARANPLELRTPSGIWETWSVGVEPGALYKYALESDGGRGSAQKADPMAFRCETPPQTASVVWPLDYGWGDSEWMRTRAERAALDAPMSIYELHLGSWRRSDGRLPGYRELAPQLAGYVLDMGFTHVEFLPLMEHPFYGSWGYQTTGFFAPSSRYGSPQDFMYLVDHLHQSGIGVILDWVPSHFPDDPHGLASFDGTHLYEYAEPWLRDNPDWDSLVFDYRRPEVRSFLLSSALFWVERYHADGLRVDAVASMLYLDFSRGEGEWRPNAEGGNENLEAIAFLRDLNRALYDAHPGVQTIAEESTAWSGVTRPVDQGGLGFGLKWDMGWMHDTLRYMTREPVERKYHHGDLTFRGVYAFDENFVLSLSHDEVVYERKSLLSKMPGDEWQRFASLRLLLGYMYAVPGKKLLFMGGELGQLREWTHDGALDWDLLDRPLHRGVQHWVRDLNDCYRSNAALHELDCAPEGFAWIDADDADHSTLAFLRRGRSPNRCLAAICNFTPVVRHDVRVGVPYAGEWREVLNGDGPAYGGSGVGNLGGVAAEAVSSHGHAQSIRVTLPPLALILLEGTAPGAGG